MANPMFSTIFYSALPTTLAGQESVLTSLALSASLNSGLSATPAFHALSELRSSRRPLPEARLSSLIDDVFRLSTPGPERLIPSPWTGWRPPPVSVRAPRLEESARSSLPKPVAIRAAGRDGDSPPAESAGPLRARAVETPTQFYDLLAAEFFKTENAYRQSPHLFLDDEIRQIEAELAVIRSRLEYWTRSLATLNDYSGSALSSFRQDAFFGLRVLLHRVFELQALIFSDPVLEVEDDPVSLHDRPQAEPPHGKILKPLRNRGIGYGPELKLREHQEFIWARVRGLLRKLVDDTAAEKNLRPLMRSGTVVMPQGGGKTRTMVACLAAAIEVGLFDAKRNDKMFILNHTDQIHAQNYKVAQLLGYYFERKFGRKIKISEYKAEEKNLFGDVVILNIPTVASEEARAQFETELAKALGSQGAVAIAAVDEIHHLESGAKRSNWKESWRGAVASLEAVSPRSFFRIGFTATPTGQEGPYIGRLRFVDLMRSGVTPRLYLYQIEGVDLNLLKVAVDSDAFDERKMRSVLLDHPKRNERIYEALEKHGLRAAAPSPSGRERLQPTLVFGFDLAHASMMARGYADYFARNVKGDLKRRKIVVIGEDEGQMAREELQAALEAYREGLIDGVAAVVSKSTPPSLRADILAAGQAGEIEAVFNVKLWGEGADLPWVTHQVGAKPTFSSIDKAQEMGRSNRRTDDEVSPQGELLDDRPRILFDVVDRLYSYDRHLIHYANLMGLNGGAVGVLGQLFDVFNGAVVERVDEEGRDIVHRRLTDIVKDRKNEIPRKPSESRPEAASNLPSLVLKLRTILEVYYEGNVDALASDLGVQPEKAQDLVDGKGWIEERWFLRRMATLLYQGRDAFVDVFNQQRGVDSAVMAADLKILRAGMAVFGRREGRNVEGEGQIRIEADLPLWGGKQATISQHSQVKLADGTLTDRNFWQIVRGLYLYFSAQTSVGGGELRMEAASWSERLKAYACERKIWTDGEMPARQALLSLGREAVLLLWGGTIPQNHGVAGLSRGDASSALARWLQRDAIVYGKKLTPGYLYGQIRILLRHAGLPEAMVRSHIQAAVAEERSWRKDGKKPAAVAEDGLRGMARGPVAVLFGGALPYNHGIRGVSPQTGALRNQDIKAETSALTRWIDGENLADVVKEEGPSPLIEEIRSLLLHFGERPTDIQRLMNAAFGESAKPRSIPRRKSQAELDEDLIRRVYEKKSWTPDDGTKSGALRREVRRAAALVSQGVLPDEWDSLIARWVRGEDVSKARAFDVAQMMRRVEEYLKQQGRFGAAMQSLCHAAIREIQGWTDDLSSAGGRLAAAGRSVAVRKFHGRLPMHHGIPGVAMQDYAADGTPKTMIASWLAGLPIAFGYSVTTEDFFNQAQALLRFGGIQEAEIEKLVIEAVYELQGWKNDPTTADGRLKAAVRNRIALRYGGQLPLDPKIPGLKRQKRDRNGGSSRTSPLIRWIRGDEPNFYHSSTRRDFEEQVRILALALGVSKGLIDQAYPMAA